MPWLPLVLRTLFNDALALVYPVDCCACSGELALGEEVVCSHCRIKLPYADYHITPLDNPVQRVFWGRVPIALATSYLKFEEKGRVQELLHRLKYRGQEEIGQTLGLWYGALLKESGAFEAVEVVVPVPLHISKYRERGYNQVSGFAKALADALQVPMAEKALRKNKASNTQTKKNRQERWEGMRHLYHIHQPALIEDKHVLLVDDVITTGATLEACAEELLNSGARAVSVASIAYTL